MLLFSPRYSGCRRHEDDELNQELSYTDRSYKREIRRLEREIPQWELMLEKSGYVEGWLKLFTTLYLLILILNCIHSINVKLFETFKLIRLINFTVSTIIYQFIFNFLEGFFLLFCFFQIFFF